MFFYILFLTLLIYPSFSFGQVSAEVVLKIPVGKSETEMGVYRDQVGIDFVKNAGNEFFVLDYVYNKIKVYSDSGNFMFHISIDSTRIERIALFDNKVIAITPDGPTLHFFDCRGKLLTSQNLQLPKTNLLHAMFYKDFIYIPTPGKNFFSENLIAYKIENTSEHGIVVNKVDSLFDSFDIERTSNFLPVEKKHHPLLQDIDITDFIEQSVQYLVYYKSPILGKMIYHVLLKENNSVQTLGVLPQKEIGYVYGIGWGRCAEIYNDAFYALGMEYDESHIKPLNVIISKIDLSDFNKNSVKLN